MPALHVLRAILHRHSQLCTRFEMTLHVTCDSHRRIHSASAMASCMCGCLACRGHWHYLRAGQGFPAGQTPIGFQQLLLLLTILSYLMSGGHAQCPNVLFYLSADQQAWLWICEELQRPSGTRCGWALVTALSLPARLS